MNKFVSKGMQDVYYVCYTVYATVWYTPVCHLLWDCTVWYNTNLVCQAGAKQVPSNTQSKGNTGKNFYINIEMYKSPTKSKAKA